MTPEERLVAALRDAHLTLALAESCTGGMVAARVTRVPRSSEALRGALVTCTDDAKAELLGVDRKLLASKGAVHKDVAREMAMRAREILSADVAISVTGFAGPDVPPGGERGLVFLGVAHWGGVEVHEMRYAGDREKVREAATQDAMRFAAEAIPKSLAARG